MRVVCIVVAYGVPDLLRAAVDSALLAGVDTVAVWDNTSSRGAGTLLGDYAPGQVRVLGDGTNWGFGGGVNRAVAGCEVGAGDAVLLLNPDAEIDAVCLAAMLQEISMRPGVVAPRMRYPDGASGIAGGPRPTLTKELIAAVGLEHFLPKELRSALLRVFAGKYGATLAPGRALDLDWVSGFCMLMNFEVFARVGGFDESYFLYYEDVDFCLRAKNAGYRVVLARGVEALHRESATTVTAGKNLHYARSRRRFLSEHGSISARRLSRMIFRA